MESLDALNLRANECSFLEIVLTDVKRYVETFAPENEKQAVLVFPPLNPRNRFLVHTLVENFFNELKTVSIGSSYGRRTVVYHCSLKPMSCETELGESKKVQNENRSSMQKAYRTPREREAQEKLFHSLMPKTIIDKSLRSTQRKQCRRPDIPIYVPKARRLLSNKAEPTISNTTNSSNSTTSCTFNTISRVPVVFDDPVPLCSNETNNSMLASQLNNKNKKCLITESFKFIDLTNEMSVNDEYNEIQATLNDVSCDDTDLSSGNHPNVLNSCNLDMSMSDTIIEETQFKIMQNESETNIKETGVETVFDNHDRKSVSKGLSDNDNTICTHNFKTDNSLDFQTLPNSYEERIIDNQQLLQENENVDDLLLFNESPPKLGNANINTYNMKPHESSSNHVDESSSPEIDLMSEFNSNCPHYCLDDSFASGPLMDVEEKNCDDAVEEPIEEMIIQESSKNVNKSTEVVENNENKDTVKKKNKKKKIIDVDECCWEDLYDKEDDYVHPLLMKELVSTMGKVQVKCTKEDYRAHQTIEERSGDGECVIEVYGFSSDLKTVDLTNQFAGFRKNNFDIIWVNDTHALAVFESPNLADRALNTPFALVKTRPLKNAIKESKLKAELVTPLPVTRPKTCTAMARRLVSSALGLKVDVSPDLLHAERTLLADAKEKKIRDSQQNHSIWNDT